ncbi:MAG: exonuclease domain-containing protein [Patescibacteria group bacterium]
MLIIDIEATGTNAHKHSILSIGAIDLQNPTNRFYGECRMWEGAHVMDEALVVNGFTEEQINDTSKQTEAELITTFMEWTQGLLDRTPAGQNVSFDRAYVEAACSRAGINFDLPFRTIDAHTLCYLHMLKRGITPPFDAEHKHSALNLDGVMNYCGIPDEPDPHNALTGAMSHAEVVSRLLYDKKLLPEFSQFEIPWL